MKRYLTTTFLLGIATLLLNLSACSRQLPPAVDAVAENEEDRDAPLYMLYMCAAPALPAAKESRPGVAVDPVVLHDCRLTVFEKQDVPSQREGVILFIGTEIRPGEVVPAERLVKVSVGGEAKTFKRLKEDDVIEAGQLLAQLDDRLARDDWLMKCSRLAAARADLAAAEKTRDEGRSRYETQLRLQSSGMGATSQEEFRAAKLNWERYFHEAESKREAVKLAELECSQAKTILDLHQVRAAIPGVVKAIHKKPGEAIKQMEPLFQIYDLSRLRLEGQAEAEYFPRLRKGMKAVVESAKPEGPEQTLRGHLEEVTGVAVSRNGKRIVSASEDGYVRVWERSSHYERGKFKHPAPVKAVACTPPSAKHDWCLSGAGDGVARLWDLDHLSDSPLRELSGQHKGAILCVAFSPDGQWCITGGDDREICLWNAGTGALQYRFPAGHRAAITSLQFTPQAQLVSAGRDQTVRVWDLRKKEAKLLSTIDKRSGDVAFPGVSPDGRRVLLDQGNVLRLLTLSDQLTEGLVANPAESAPFSTFAVFSPDTKLILTAGAAEGKLQLWRSPTASTRPYELRRLTAREQSPPTSAAFAPDGSFVAVGTKDRQVLVWPLPSAQEIEEPLTAEIVLVEAAVESAAGQVRVWAEIKNPDDPRRRLLPGTTATLAVYPPSNDKMTR